MSTPAPLAPAVVAELRRLTRTELSMRARVAYVLLALVASAMTIVIVSLWLTEPALPLRTTVAFAVLTGIGLGWVTFCTWVLRSRYVLLARHRVVAGRLAASFSSMFVLGCVLVGLSSSSRGVWLALAMGIASLVVAVAVWRRAETAHSSLLARRNALERELSGRTQ
jgi:hypothetical protein